MAWEKGQALNTSRAEKGWRETSQLPCFLPSFLPSLPTPSIPFVDSTLSFLQQVTELVSAALPLSSYVSCT